MYYNECPYCGATLDPNEKCDCQGVTDGMRMRIAVTRAQESIAELGVAVTVLGECLIKKELAPVGERERKQT